MIQNTEGSDNHRGRSCFSTGCIIVVVLFIAVAIWIGSAFVLWKKCTIPLPDGSGSVVYMARLNKIFCAEWDRAIRFQTKNHNGTFRWIPMDTAGADPVNVYWYAAKGDSGPYLRFRDPLTEYVADLRLGKTYIINFQMDGRCTMQEIMGSHLESWGDPREDNRLVSDPGLYLGRIEYPFNKFVSKKVSPEKLIKTF